MVFRSMAFMIKYQTKEDAENPHSRFTRSFFVVSKAQPEREKVIGLVGQDSQGDFAPETVVIEEEDECILEHRLIKALKELNKSRNALVHPFAKGKLKRNAIVPGRGENSDRASRVYRLLCHIIDIAGGKSPLKNERELASYIRERRQMQRKKSRQRGMENDVL